MIAEGENRNMVRKLLISNQNGPKNYQIEEQDMADQIFGVPGPGGGAKRPNMTILGFLENHILCGIVAAKLCPNGLRCTSF